MSGHSKWSTIKRYKGIKDAKRGELFSKMSRLITVSAREGGGDPDSNAKLRLAIEKAKEARMPKENIERAILKGVGKGASGSVLEVIYEGFGPNGEAFLVRAFTDNNNRTVSEIRTIFNKCGGNLGGSGSTAYIFGEDYENPIFKVETTDSSKEKLLNLYETLTEHDDVSEVYTNFDLE